MVPWDVSMKNTPAHIYNSTYFEWKEKRKPAQHVLRDLFFSLWMYAQSDVLIQDLRRRIRYFPTISQGSKNSLPPQNILQGRYRYLN